MDRLLLTWILQHSMKHSFARVIQEISQGEPCIEFQPCLEVFVLYATCNKILSTRRNGDYEDRKMLYAALEKFMESMPSVSDHEISKKYTQLLCILKWTNRAQRILGSPTDPIGDNVVASLRRMNNTFENEWNTLTGEVLPCNDVFQETKSKLTGEASFVSNAYLKLITEFSLHAITLLEICLAVMQSFLPPTGVEDIIHLTHKSSAVEVNTHCSNSFERFNCVFSMIKNDTSEDGLLSVVKLIHQMPLIESPSAAVPEKIQTLAGVNTFGRDALNGYKKRLHYYKGILRTKQKGYLISPFNRAVKPSPKPKNLNVDFNATTTSAELDTEMESLVSDGESTPDDIPKTSDLVMKFGKDEAGLLSGCKGKSVICSQENSSSQNILVKDHIPEMLTESEVQFSCDPDPLSQ